MKVLAHSIYLRIIFYVIHNLRNSTIVVPIASAQAFVIALTSVLETTADTADV